MENEIFLDQKDNYNAKFGKVLRSASTLYYIRSKQKGLDSTVSFMNYWKIKNNMDVTVLANVRNMSGELLFREELNFENGDVVNYRPQVGDEFEGSVEIEIFSLQNLRYPYPAIMVVYVGKGLTTMTHTYGRVYSAHEVEDGNTIPLGLESCWSVRDNSELKSFCIFHNGNDECPEQIIQLELSKFGSDEKALKEIKFKKLAPYETIKLYTKDFFPDIEKFLAGGSGNVSINFKLKNAFTRLMVGHELLQDGSMQVTHSNFNYKKIKTDIVEGSNAVYTPPRLGLDSYSVVIYPDRTEGEFKVKNGFDTYSLAKPETVRIPVSGGERLIFSGKGNKVPSRIVLGVEFGIDKDKLSECSLNIFHNNKPHKRFHWGNFLPGKDAISKLLFTDLKELFDGIADENIIVLRFYSSSRHGYIERRYNGSDYAKLEKDGFNISTDNEIQEYINGEMGWWSIFSDYVGLYPYVFIEDKRNKTYSLEHAF